MAGLGRLAVKEPVERADDVVLPGIFLLRLHIGDVEGDGAVEIAGAQGASGALGRRHGKEGALVDGRRKDEALVVVCMVAQDLDASGRVGRDCRFSPEELLELGYD